MEDHTRRTEHPTRPKSSLKGLYIGLSIGSVVAVITGFLANHLGKEAKTSEFIGQIKALQGHHSYKDNLNDILADYLTKVQNEFSGESVDALIAQGNQYLAQLDSLKTEHNYRHSSRDKTAEMREATLQAIAHYNHAHATDSSAEIPWDNFKYLDGLLATMKPMETVRIGDKSLTVLVNSGYSDPSDVFNRSGDTSHEILYAFWEPGKDPVVKTVDLTGLDWSAQEILN